MAKIKCKNEKKKHEKAVKDHKKASSDFKKQRSSWRKEYPIKENAIRQKIEMMERENYQQWFIDWVRSLLEMRHATEREILSIQIPKIYDADHSQEAMNAWTNARNRAKQWDKLMNARDVRNRAAEEVNRAADALEDCYEREEEEEDEDDNDDGNGGGEMGGGTGGDGGSGETGDGWDETSANPPQKKRRVPRLCGKPCRSREKKGDPCQIYVGADGVCQYHG